MTSEPESSEALAKPDIKDTSFFINLTQTVAIILVIVGHFNFPYLSDGKQIFALSPFGVFIGSIGFSLLLCSLGAKLKDTLPSDISIRDFYWQGFKQIYPMFWIAFIIGTMYMFLVNGGNLHSNAPPKSLILSLIGMDGLASSLGINSFYLLGEWFLGLAILCFLIYPVLNWGVSKKPIPTAVMIAVIYFTMIVIVGPETTYSTAVMLPTRLPELAVGLYFVQYRRKIPYWWIIPAIGILAYFQWKPETNEDVATTFVGISLFVLLIAIAQVIQKLNAQITMAAFELISKYSYAIFLVHHVIIVRVYQSLTYWTYTPLQLYILFLANCLIIFLAAFALYKLNDNVMAFFTKAFARKKPAKESVKTVP